MIKMKTSIQKPTANHQQNKQVNNSVSSRRSEFTERSPVPSRNIKALEDSTIDVANLPTYAQSDVQCSPVPQSTTPNPRTKVDLTLMS